MLLLLQSGCLLDWMGVFVLPSEQAFAHKRVLIDEPQAVRMGEALCANSDLINIAG